MKKVAIYTIDLFNGREYLMPWRTVLEVGNGIVKSGNQAVIINGCHSGSDICETKWLNIPIHRIAYGWNSLVECKYVQEADVLFVPVTWRTGFKSLGVLAKLNCRKVAYLPGGVYDFKGSLFLKRNSSYIVALPYLIESLVPKAMLGKKLRDAGFDMTIGLTELSANTAKKNKLPRPICIYPGMDNFATISRDDRMLEKYGLKGKKWFLFTGATALIRGASVLIKAVDRAYENMCIVMLLRGDKGTSVEDVINQTKTMKHRERIIVIKEKLSREQLHSFFASAWYGVLPFLSIPSEIPLTYFEMLACGTPVVSFPNGGTTAYLGSALVLADRSVKGLAHALEKSWADSDLRQKKSRVGIEIMSNHPAWDEIVCQWVNIIESEK